MLKKLLQVLTIITNIVSEEYAWVLAIITNIVSEGYAWVFSSSRKSKQILQKHG